MTPEGLLKQKIKKFLDALKPHCWYFCPMMMGYGRSGIPDFVGSYCGQFFAIETKAPGKRLTPWQEQERDGINASGSPDFVVYDFDEFVAEWNRRFK